MKLHYHPITGVIIQFSEDEVNTAVLYLECMASGFDEAGNKEHANNIMLFVKEIKKEEKRTGYS